jgi:spectinomycin phosphotransferase
VLGVIEDPQLDPRELASALHGAYGVEALAYRFIPGYDFDAASYEVATDGLRGFLKVHFSEPAAAPLELVRALFDSGIANVVAPRPTLASGLSHAMGDGRYLVLYPYVAGRNAMVAAMTDGQWRAFGAALRAVHDSPLRESFADRLPSETFRLPSADLVRRVLEMAQAPNVSSTAATRLATFLADHRGQIERMLQRADELRAKLRARPLRHALCHADAHGANVLVADDGRVLLVDWDGAMLAPRERDLLFVIGSRVANTVEPHEEASFFDGYGLVEVDREAIVYYRYERIFEDLGVDATSVFSDRTGGASAETQVAMIASNFGPGGMVEAVERI